MSGAFVVQDERVPRTGLPEEARYFEVPGAHLYTVLHRVTSPAARSLLIGPFASERYFAYHSWVRWARYLAARGVEVLRFDYRGVGESTGNFEEMNFNVWEEDVRLLAGWFVNRSPKVPLVLHGMELGAIFAERSFDESIGDALLLWSPPTNANQVLRSTILRWCGLEQIYESPNDRKTASEYIRQLEEGSPIDVQGYLLSSRLWKESFDFETAPGVRNNDTPDGTAKKPVKAVGFGRNTERITMPYLLLDEAKDFSPLYRDNFDWMAKALGLPVGGTQ